MSGAGPHGRVLVWGLSGLITAAVLAYLHTGHAFRTVIVPLVDARIEGSLGVAGGSLRADGRIEAIGLVYRSRGIAIEVEMAQITISPWSLLSGRIPRILELSMLGTRVETRPPESGADPTSDAIGD